MTAIVLLIKRPLIEIGPVLIAGFDPKRLQREHRSATRWRGFKTCRTVPNRPRATYEPQ